MTLGVGNKLFKLSPEEDAAAKALSRIRDFIYAMPDEGMEVSDQTLANLLCPSESYVVHEVVDFPVHYTTEKIELGEADGYRTVVTPKLKVVY